MTFALRSRRLLVVIVSTIIGATHLGAHEESFPPGDSVKMPAIAVEPESRTWALVWQQGQEIRVVASRDGRSFSAPQKLSGKDRAQPLAPSVAVDRSGRIGVVWADTSSRNPGIFLSRSVDGGASFSPPHNLAAKTDLPLDPKIAFDHQGRSFVVWSGLSEGSRDVFLARSTDGGKSFSAPKNLSANRFASELPAIAVDGKDRLYVAWRDKTPPTIQIWLTRSTDGGESFSSPRVVSRTGFSNTPTLAAEGDGHLYISWVSNVAGNLEVYFIHSADGGESFDRLLNISGTRLSSHSPSLATDGGGDVFAVWVDDTPGKPEVFFRYSADHGTSFFGKKRLSVDSPASATPAVAAIPGRGIFVAWEDQSAGQDRIRFIDQEAIRQAPVQ